MEGISMNKISLGMFLFLLELLIWIGISYVAIHLIEDRVWAIVFAMVAVSITQRMMDKRKKKYEAD